MAATSKARLQRLVPSVAETAGACDAACLRCLVPLLAKTAGAYCQTQLARNVLCPCWPRLLGLAVHTVSLPAISKPLWRHCHSACCKKNSSLPTVLCRFAVTVAGLIFDCCFDCCAAVPSTPFCTTATVDLACPRCLAPSLAETARACSQTFVACLRCHVPLLAKTAGDCVQMFVACLQCLAPLLAKTTRLAVYRISLPTKSSTLVGQDRGAHCP
jgi:hypothetical protein